MSKKTIGIILIALGVVIVVDFIGCRFIGHWQLNGHRLEAAAGSSHWYHRGYRRSLAGNGQIYPKAVNYYWSTNIHIEIRECLKGVTREEL